MSTTKEDKQKLKVIGKAGNRTHDKWFIAVQQTVQDSTVWAKSLTTKVRFYTVTIMFAAEDRRACVHN